MISAFRIIIIKKGKSQLEMVRAKERRRGSTRKRATMEGQHKQEHCAGVGIKCERGLTCARKCRTTRAHACCTRAVKGMGESLQSGKVTEQIGLLLQ